MTQDGRFIAEEIAQLIEVSAWTKFITFKSSHCLTTSHADRVRIRHVWQQLSEILTRMLQMPCDISKDLVGADIQIARIGEEKRDR